MHAHFDANRSAKVILVAPRDDAGPHAAALGDGLENLARTLSIEWARFGVRTSALLPGAGASDAELVAWICSPAGDYLSGTALRGAGAYGVTAGAGAVPPSRAESASS